jgi:hypothetical protein
VIQNGIILDFSSFYEEKEYFTIIMHYALLHETHTVLYNVHMYIPKWHTYTLPEATSLEYKHVVFRKP